MSKYSPEGINIYNSNITYNRLVSALDRGDILEAKVIKCNINNDLYIETLDTDITVVIKANEIEYAIRNRKIKKCALISRIGKMVKFKVKNINTVDGKKIVECSRLDAQKECYDNYISKLTTGDIINANVTRVDKHGIFCDIGCGINALIPVENISTVHVLDPEKYYKNLKEIHVVIKDIKNNGIILSHKELLGTWSDQLENISVGDILPGIVTTVKEYGAFVRINQNLVGLADLDKEVNINDRVQVYVRNIDSKKMKIKLSILNVDDSLCNDIEISKFNYKITDGHISEWRYSPENCDRFIGTYF